MNRPGAPEWGSGNCPRGRQPRACQVRGWRDTHAQPPLRSSRGWRRLPAHHRDRPTRTTRWSCARLIRWRSGWEGGSGRDHSGHAGHSVQPSYPQPPDLRGWRRPPSSLPWRLIAGW